MSKITLTLSIPQTNRILEALGQLPYAQVYELVDEIHHQAGTQVGQDAGRLEAAS
ncbi:hypothetical protein [Nonomuraea guangzhouensis]|uniref:Uncharacterized protein n=1 Tax=Nonomuraea guangzhouensis TaxID=1291555 RepID=A0ABW4GUY8_9ACTN|nr:hypothetical protein [Nonomuraea guangzhouensis]